MKPQTLDSLVTFLDWHPTVGPWIGSIPRDWRVAAGDRIALNGPSGSGKTLLLRSWMGLEPTQGQRYLQGQRVILLPDFRRRVQFIPQVPTFESRLSAADAIGARTSALQERAASELERLGVADPTALLVRSVEVASGGEKARLALVRSLLLDPDVILLDEPTVALDADNEARFEVRLQEWIEENPWQRALVFTSHSQAQRMRLASEEWELGIQSSQ